MKFKYVDYNEQNTEDKLNKLDKLIARAEGTNNENEKNTCLELIKALEAKGLKPTKQNDIIYTYRIQFHHPNGKLYKNTTAKTRILYRYLKEIFPINIYTSKEMIPNTLFEYATYQLVYTPYKEVLQHIDVITKYFTSMTQTKTIAWLEGFMKGIQEHYAVNAEITGLSKVVIDGLTDTNKVGYRDKKINACSDGYAAGQRFKNEGKKIDNRKMLN